jgi:hypothetical protein
MPCGSQHAGVAYSHVWVPKVRGTGRKYDIPEQMLVFEDGGAYMQALEAGREMHVAERPALFIPLLVDIDLRFAPGEVVRAFDDEFYAMSCAHTCSRSRSCARPSALTTRPASALRRT